MVAIGSGGRKADSAGALGIGGPRKGIYRPKGRETDARALNEVRRLLGQRPRGRDQLIEHLHLLQDAYGHLSAAHLTALAAEMRLSMAEVFEVATFYQNFDVVKEGEDAPPAVTLRVCDSLSCEMAGSRKLAEALAAEYGATVRVTHGACMGRCDAAPVVRLKGPDKDGYVDKATTGKVGAALADKTPPPLAPYPDLETYRSRGGYEMLTACRRGEPDAESVIGRLEQSGLRGLGGAGFPTGRKWRFVHSEPAPRIVAVNADESEPGTFKDRYFLLNEPHRVLEGALIAASVMEASEVYIFLRDEYADIRQILEREIEALEKSRFLDEVKIVLRRGAGAYICGEESAMLESLEGKRALPRQKPPFPAQVGLFGQPTLINNVETLYWIRDILEKEPDWFRRDGRHGAKGIRTFSVSGRVKQPGVHVAPAGITARELIEEYCGGMADGHEFKAYLPGGASGGILPASMAGIPLDFGTLEEQDCFIGSAALIVLSDQDDMAGVALNLMRFFEDESCGQCTPCREGTAKMVSMMEGAKWDEGLMEELAQCMTDASICGLGQAAPNGLLSLFRHFREDAR